MNKKDLVLQRVKEYLDFMKIEYDTEVYGLRIRFDKDKTLRDNTVKDTYTVSYYVKVFDYLANYVTVDAESLELLYIMTPQQYIEIVRG